MPSTNQTDAGDQKRRQTLKIVFLTLFLDLVGFSIIFPLFPAMLEYYLPEGSGDGSLLGQIIAPIYQFAANSNAADPTFMTAVLFGGLLGSLYSVLQFICAPLWGRYSDRVGRRKVLLITITGLALSYLAWFFAASFWVLVLARILGGIMGGNLSVATAAVADVTTREKRAGGMAIVGIAFGLGFLVGPAVGGLCSLINLLEFAPSLEGIGLNPFSVPALVSFLLAILNLIWVARRFEETHPIEARDPSKRAGLPVLDLFRSPSPQVRKTNLIYLLYMFAFSGMEFTLTFLAVERFDFSPAQNGGMFVYIGFILILVQGGIVRRMAPKLGETKLAKSGLALGSVAFVLLAFALQLSPFFIALGLMAFSIGLASPTLSALVSLYASEQDQGKELGIFRSAGSLARAIGPICAALVYFNWGSQSAYLFGACIIVLPFLMALNLPKPTAR
ncbi:MFS transporter [Coraliomargarita akajimensis]|uniref:Major facilitator superfamily MFS_1 n=1 Tax=Coraliomargarita akajimensis (strain DSM 45221 / IAM 15411 / JCM 23193 / KCTC 12865 / 04OKA010-24) TaxID=583355 RepID=D5EIE7_CORAD|nr:MFS transporter [Coraliomargarita akajimensis]ADE54213.1 major facilitator superfamily MFS_1 [Coraliomargarita akajimensis DSM 45221]